MKNKKSITEYLEIKGMEEGSSHSMAGWRWELPDGWEVKKLGEVSQINYIAMNLINGIGFGSSEYIVFRSNDLLFNEYLYYFLSQEKFKIEGAKRMAGAVGHKRVSKDFIENSIIHLPDFSNQHLIVIKLDALSAETKRLESIYQQKISALDELKKSILDKAFKGEL